MERINVLIVDDEPLARRKIRQLLETDPQIGQIAESANAMDAVQKIQQIDPAILFLDVEMPEADGFSVITSLEGKTLPLIIFITAYDQYALKAFEVYAFDYLLKPFDYERFEKTVERAKRKLDELQKEDLVKQLKQLFSKAKPGASLPTRLAVKNGQRVSFVNIRDIDWIEAEGNYVRIHIGKESHLLRDAISNMESRLDPGKFLRIHRSTIVNIDRIRELHSWFHGEYHVILQNGKELLLTRSYRDNLRGLLGR